MIEVPDEVTVAVGPAVLYPERLELQSEGAVVALTASQVTILRLLMSRPGRAVPRAELMKQLTGFCNERQSRLVDAQIERLRNRLQAAGMDRWMIRSAHSLGYLWEEFRTCQ